MALRNLKPLRVSNWKGLDSFSNVHEITPDTWFDANNVIVDAGGGAAVLRSPKAFGSPMTGFSDSDSDSADPSSASSTASSDDDLPISSMAEYKRASGGHILFVDKGPDTYTIDVNGSTTGRRSDQALQPWISVNVNNTLQRINTDEFIQYLDDFACYRNGIDAPAAAPTISWTDDDSSDSISDTCSVENSVQVSYAYKNSDTGHIGPPSPLSEVLGPTDADHTLRVAVVASTQIGVDKIVLFITLDGGSIPYLAIDCETGDVLEYSNTTGNIDIPNCSYDVDTLTPETIYNQPPPEDGEFMFSWKDRIILLRDRFVQYSGWESAYAGNAYECWPPLNQMTLPNKSDTPISGISTQVGALIFGMEDSYMISGYPSDKVSSPNNTLAITEHVDPLNWKLGIYENGKETPVNTPFGVMWVDQNRKIRLWTMREFPKEIGVPLRDELAEMSGFITAQWHQHAKNAGFYIIRNSSKVLMIMAYQTADGQMAFGYGKSDVETDVIQTITFSAPGNFTFAKDNQVYKWLDPDLRGDGWENGTEIFFKTKVGNDGNFSYIHSMSIEGDIDQTLTVKVNGDIVPMENDIDTDTSYYGVVDQEARRHTVEFRWNKDDAAFRSIQAMQIAMRHKRRVI